jgi:hypothetical protein
MAKKEDGNKVFQDFKKPSLTTTDDYNSVPAKSNWNSNIKFCFCSINKEYVGVPIWLCHLLMLTTFKLKTFGEDAYGKFFPRCKVGA